ncbi:MAG TPA: hypothetical protein VMX58_02885 [Patescibacteria group bacterium]|nr:hypothetical protein [Patescibacteria group bacterium]
MSASALTNSRKDGRYRASLKTLSDRELLSGLEGLHGTEREAQLKILYNLIEVDQRRLYLLLGFGSLFEFCTDHPGYTKSSAGRRIRAARYTDRFPEFSELFRRCTVNRTFTPNCKDNLTDTGAPERVLLEQKYKLEFSVNQNFMKNLNKIRSLLSTKYPRSEQPVDTDRPTEIPFLFIAGENRMTDV